MSDLIDKKNMAAAIEEHYEKLNKTKRGLTESDFFCDGKWEMAERFWYKVIAWMPLPEPYRKGITNG